MLLHINCVKLLCTAPLQLRLNQTADGWQQQHRLAGLVLTMKCWCSNSPSHHPPPPPPLCSELTSELWGSCVCTWTSVPLEVHMIPFSVVDLSVDSLGLGGPWTHVQQQVEVPVQHLDGKKIHLKVTGCYINILWEADMLMAGNKNANYSCKLQYGDWGRSLSIYNQIVWAILFNLSKKYYAFMKTKLHLWTMEISRLPQFWSSVPI